MMKQHTNHLRIIETQRKFLRSYRSLFTEFLRFYVSSSSARKEGRIASPHLEELLSSSSTFSSKEEEDFLLSGPPLDSKPTNEEAIPLLLPTSIKTSKTHQTHPQKHGITHSSPIFSSVSQIKAIFDEISTLISDATLSGILSFGYPIDRREISAHTPPSSGSMNLANISLFPTPFPKSQFDEAVALAKGFNHVLDAVTCDISLLCEMLLQVAEVDEFYQRLLAIVKRVYSVNLVEGYRLKAWSSSASSSASLSASYCASSSSRPSRDITKDLRLHLVRSDYMLHEELNRPFLHTVNSTAASKDGEFPATNSSRKANDESQVTHTQLEEVDEPNSHAQRQQLFSLGNFSIKQVELNTISSSFVGLADALSQVHRASLRRMLIECGCLENEGNLPHTTGRVQKSSSSDGCLSLTEEILMESFIDETLRKNSPVYNFSKAIALAVKAYKEKYPYPTINQLAYTPSRFEGCATLEGRLSDDLDREAGRVVSSPHTASGEASSSLPTVATKTSPSSHTLSQHTAPSPSHITHRNPLVLFVVVDSERNEMDQRFLSHQLEKSFNLPCMRASIEELYQMWMHGALQLEEEDDGGKGTEGRKQGIKGMESLGVDGMLENGRSAAPLTIPAASSSSNRPPCSPTVTHTPIILTPQDISTSYTVETGSTSLKPGRLILHRTSFDGTRRFSSEICLVYFRTTYHPSQFAHTGHWLIREIIEWSHAIKVPSIPAHLAGSKKIQQSWCDMELLRALLTMRKDVCVAGDDSQGVDADRLAQCFALQVDPSEVESEGLLAGGVGGGEQRDGEESERGGEEGGKVGGEGVKRDGEVRTQDGEQEKESPLPSHPTPNSTTTPPPTPLLPHPTSSNGFSPQMKKLALLQAYSHPHRFILKPQREGGGNNLNGNAITELIRSSLLSTEGRKNLQQYILMEKIRVPSFPFIRLQSDWGASRVENLEDSSKMMKIPRIPTSSVEMISGVSELGIFASGLYREVGKMERFPSEECTYSGYLLRTKGSSSAEGGIMTGFAVLNSPLLLEDDVESDEILRDIQAMGVLLHNL